MSKRKPVTRVSSIRIQHGGSVLILEATATGYEAMEMMEGIAKAALTGFASRGDYEYVRVPRELINPPKTVG